MREGKDINKEVKLLARQQKFEQIYQEYGPKYFRKYVSRKYKNKDIKNLIKEGKYLDIYVKYGETYAEVYRKDIENELGRKSTLPERICTKNFIIRQMEYLRAFMGGAIIGLSTVLLGNSASTDIEEVINSQKYAEEIDEYENKIKEYSEKFNIDTQSDMEIIMRVMKDMHETIRGYGEPEIDAVGYRGMDVMYEDGIGVCRNMAENVTDKLNEINPEYNARIVTLYQKTGDFIECNIENNIISGNMRININGNVENIYLDEELKQTIIEQDDTKVSYKYENGRISKKTIETPKQKEEIFYDENGNILKNRKTITEENENSKIQKVYVDGRLESENEKNKNYYISIMYNEMGQITSKRIADEESERTTIYDDNEQVDFMTIVKDGYKTTIHYNEQGKEIRRIQEETDATNIFLELVETKEEFEKQEEREKNKINENGQIMLANHVIVAVDIKSDNVTLLIDSTNLGLGVYKDGKIQMFNETQPSEAIYDRSFAGHGFYKGIDGLLQYPVDYVKSFRESTLSMEELEEKYGIDAQNKMLEKIEREDKKKSFKEELKIDTGITYDFNTNVVSIDNTVKVIENESEL